MANSSGVVGVLRALLTADTAQFDTSMRKAVKTTETTTTAIGGLSREVQKLTPQAERMVKAFSGERLLAAANNLVAAVERSGGAAKLTEAQQKRVNATLTEAIAKYKALGVAAPQALLATEKATRGAASATSILQSTFATLTASFSTALIVNRVVGGITSLINEAVAGAGALADLSKTTGLSIKTLQQMQFVADQTTGTLENFTGAAFKLGVNIASGTTSARDAFDDLTKSSDALGMSFEAFQRLTPDEQWNRITKALLAVEDEQERNRLGVALMGKQYQQVASAIAQNYAEIAQGAKVSTDAQIKEIDRALDAWRKFIKDTTVSFQATIGNALLWARALRQAIDEMGVFATTASVMARAQEILDKGLLDARTKDIALTKQSAQAHADYIAQLRHLNEQLDALKPAEIAQIQAALKIGESAADLEAEYHLDAGALALLTARTKDYTSEANKQAAAIERLAQLSASAFGLDTIDRAKQTVDAIGGISGVVLMSADAIKSLNALLNEAIDAAERNGQLVPLEWFRIEEATRANVGTLQDYLKLLGDLPAEMNKIPPPPGFQKALEEARARADLAQSDFNKQKQIAGVLADIAGRRAQADIDLAKIRGASVTEVAALERREAQRTLDAVLAGIQAEVQAREAEVQVIQDVIDASKAAGEEVTDAQKRSLARAKADLEAQRAIAQVQTQAAVEDFNLGERNKQEAIERTTNVWIRAWDQMRSTSDSTIAAVAGGIADLEHQTVGKLGNILFGLRDVDTTGLKRAAAEAKKHFEEMQRTGRATAEEIHDAFNEWREKEEEANNTFAFRFKQVWRGIKSTLVGILNDLLKYFTEQFLVGLVKGISGAKLGQRLGSQLAAGIPGAGGGGGGAGSSLVQSGVDAAIKRGASPFLGKIPGLGGFFGGGAAAATTGAGAAAALGTSAGVAAGVGAGAAVVPPTFLAAAPALGATGGGVIAGSSAAPAAAGAGVSAGAIAATAGIAGAAIAAYYAWRHWGRKGQRGNDARDKFLAQFASFDNKRDDKNPPGFYGLDLLLTKYKHHDWFDQLVRARNPKDVKKAEQTIADFSAATLHRKLKVFHRGGVIDDEPINSHGEVLIKALRHESVLTKAATKAIGGSQTINALNANPVRAMAMGLSAMTPAPMPMSSPVGTVSMSPAPLVSPSGSTSSSVNREVHLHMDIRAIDAQDVGKFVRSRAFIYPLREVLKRNVEGLGSTTRYVTTGEP